MEAAAQGIVTAKNEAVDSINIAKIDATTSIQAQRDMAIAAVRLEKAGLLEKFQKLFDPFLELFRKGE